jgi:hypothetical protein
MFSSSTNRFLKFYYKINSGGTVTKIGTYELKHYINDLLSLIICLQENFDQQILLLELLQLSPDECKKKFMPMLDDVRLNFKLTLNETIGGPDRILILFLVHLTAVLKKYPKEMTPFLSALISSQVNLMKKELDEPSGIGQNLTMIDGADLKCLKAVLDIIKPKEIEPKLAQNLFKVLYRMLFVGTLYEHDVIK